MDNSNKYKDFFNKQEKVKKKSLRKKFKNLYGLDEDEKEDLNFVHTTYNNVNEQPAKLAKIVVILVSIIFSSFIIWAYFANIDELARGMGKVIPSDKIQHVQSFDGGVVSDILIKEGQTVKKGDPLLKIDTTRFKASFEENRQEYLNLLAIKVRLEAEANININDPMPTLVFPKSVIKDNPEYVLSEKKLLKSRYEELKSSFNVLSNQLAQKKEELKEIEYTVKHLIDRFKIVKEQKTTLQRLAKKGSKSKFDVLNIEKEYNQISSNLDTSKLSISRSKLAIKEASLKIKERLDIFKSKASSKLQDTLAQLNKLESRLVSDKDKIIKSVIKSPVDGTIKQIYANTIGGVVRPGVDLVEIVPSNDTLLVEAKIDPKDIAFINPTQKAVVKITAYDFSIYGGLEGKIVSISADSIVDKKSNGQKSYYRIVLKTDKNYLEKNGKRLPIIPGMVASVDIITGKKTILDFILKPILKTKQNAFTQR